MLLTAWCLAVTALLAACTTKVYVATPAASVPASTPSPAAAASPAIVTGAKHTCTIPLKVVTDVVGLGPNPGVEFTSEDGAAKLTGLADCHWSSTAFTATDNTTISIDYGSIADSKIPIADGLGEAKVNQCISNEKIHSGAVPNSFICGFVAVARTGSGLRSSVFKGVMVSRSNICYIAYGYSGTGLLDESWAVDIVKQLQAAVLPYLDR